MSTALDHRVLVLAPRGRDAAVVHKVLEGEVDVQVVANVAELASAVAEGAGAVVVTEEALGDGDLQPLIRRVEGQSPWSDLPFIILSAHRVGLRPALAQSTLARLANVVLLERPINPETLQRGAASALRARRRQYLARDHLEDQRRSAERLELAMRAGRLGAWSFDLIARRLDASDECKAQFGRRPEDPFTAQDVIDSLGAADRQRQAEAVRHAVSSEQDFLVEQRVVWPNGESRWIEVRGRATRSPNGQVAGLNGVSQDVTQRYAAQSAIAEGQAALEALNQTLEARIAERTEDLARANARLLQEMDENEQMQSALMQSQKMEAVGQLTGGVAHDFNNLLTIIRSSVDFLKQPQISEVRRARYIDAISQTVDRAARLTGQLLAFARRQALTPTLFDVGERVASVVELVRPLVGARIQIEVELPEQPCLARADLNQFETALINLAVNARDAMNGEGRLRLQVEAVDEVPPMRGHAGSMGEFIAVSVRDSGCGIAEAELARIFEPFFTTKAVGKGTGLGLSQVFGFAKQSGGDVNVDTAPSQGSTFRLYLPRIQVHVEPVQPALAGATVVVEQGAGLRILVVEDNDAVGQFAVEMLADLGHHPTRAANAEEALSLLRGPQNGFEAVFSDVVMPGMNGLELAKTIRGERPDLPVLLASGYSSVLAEEGAHGFQLLHKPYSVQMLAEVLGRISVQPR